MDMNSPTIAPAVRRDLSFVDFNDRDPSHRAALAGLIKQQAEAHGSTLSQTRRDEDLVLALKAGRARAILGQLVNQDDPRLEGKIVALMTYGRAVTEIGPTLYLEDIVVDKNVRNLKIGTSAMFELAKRAVQKNTVGVKWYVRRDNKMAQHMYGKFSDTNYDERPPILVFQESRKLQDIPVLPESQIRRATEHDVPAITRLLKKDYNWNGIAELAVGEAVAGNRELDGKAESFTFVSTNRQGRVNGVMIASRGLSTFRVANTTHIHVMAFSSPDAMQQNLPGLLHHMAAQQEIRGWGTSLYVDIGHMQAGRQREALSQTLRGNGAQALCYDGEPMVAGTLSNRAAVYHERPRL